MKTRIDFITNSSSSSYVIAFKSFDDEMKKLPKKVKKIIEALIQIFFDDKVTNEKELQDYLCQNYDYESLEEMLEDEWLREKYELYLSKIKEGYTIAFLDVAYNDDITPARLRDIEDGENFIILDNLE